MGSDGAAQDVPLNKPDRTVRIAFVGASTTIAPHTDPFSYPEYIEPWLREWARVRNLQISFEVVNAAREGIASNSIRAIVEQELVPVRPDLVVDYEGGNQFWPGDFLVGSLPGRSLVDRVRPAPGLLQHYSALAVRTFSFFDAIGGGGEPRKPALAIAWPTDLDESDPPARRSTIAGRSSVDSSAISRDRGRRSPPMEARWCRRRPYGWWRLASCSIDGATLRSTSS